MPYTYLSRAAAEEVHGPLEWTWEAAASYNGIRAFFNHGPRFLGSKGPLGITLVIVPDTRKGTYENYPS